MRRFVHALSPAGHQEAPPRQLAASAAAGAFEHGAASQVRLLGESAPALGGQGESEHGADPNWHEPAHTAPPPTAHVPDENPARLTNSMVTSRASSVPPPRQRPPPLVKLDPFQPLK